MEQQNAPPFLPPSLHYILSSLDKKSMGFDKTLPDTAGNICRNETKLKSLYSTVFFYQFFVKCTHFWLAKRECPFSASGQASRERRDRGHGPALVNSSGRTGQEGRALSYVQKAVFFKKNSKQVSYRVSFQFVFKRIYVLHVIFSRKLINETVLARCFATCTHATFSRDGKGEEERRAESTTMNGTNYRVAKKVQRRRS